MTTPADDNFLRRALRLAMDGRGHVEPNPMVGCVLVKNGQIIGEGWHAKVGEAHAEPNALNDCKSRGNDPAGATAYVTLEPCCHTNKRTPPCAPRLIEARVARVVIGCLDPNPDVNGKGVAMLREAGIAVDALSEPGDAHGWPSVGVRGLDASVFRQLIAPFTLRQSGLRPYVTLKWAQSADGKVAGIAGARARISNAASSGFVHAIRARADAIVVGARTAIVDDPQLTARPADGRIARIADRIVIDRGLRLPLDGALARTARDVPTIAVVSLKARRPRAEVNALMDLGVRLVWPGKNSDDFLGTALAARDLVGSPYQHVLVEPGPTLAGAFFAANLCDRLWVIRSPIMLGADATPGAPQVPDDFVPTGTLDLDGDTLTEYLNTRSPAYFATTPSADFVLAKEGFSP